MSGSLTLLSVRLPMGSAARFALIWNSDLATYRDTLQLELPELQGSQAKAARLLLLRANVRNHHLYLIFRHAFVRERVHGFLCLAAVRNRIG